MPDYLNPPQPISLQGLREALTRRLGAAPGSPVDSIFRKPEQVVDRLQAIPGAASDYLLKAPPAPTQLPYADPKRMGPFAPPSAASAGLAQAGQPATPPIMPPSGFQGPFSDASKIPQGATTVPWAQDPSQVGGWIQKGTGLGLTGEAWLKDRQANMPSTAPAAPRGNPQITNLPNGETSFSNPMGREEELYRRANSPIGTYPYGSAQQAAAELGDITGDTMFDRLAKLQQLEAAKVNALGGVQQQQEVSRGALDVEKERQRGAGQKYEAMQNLLAAGVVPGGSVSISGVGSVRAPAATNLNPLLNQVTNMRFAAESAIGRKWSWDGPSPEERALRQSIENVMMQDRATPPDVKNTVREILSSPSLAGIPNEDIIADAANDDGTSLTPLQQQKLSEYLSAFR